MSELFNGQTTDPNATVPTDVNTLLASIKNEQGTQKYTSVEEALKGHAHAQAYIQELKTKLAAEEAEKVRLAAEAAKAANIDDVVSKIAAQLQATKEVHTTVTQPLGLDEKAVQDLVQRQLEQQKQLEAAQRNVAEVEQHLTTRFGEKAKEQIAAKAAEFGMTPEQLGGLAQTNPKLVLQLFGTSQTKSLPTSTSSVNLHGTPSQGDEIKLPDKSVLSGPGATLKNQLDLLHQIRRKVYKQYDVTE